MPEKLGRGPLAATLTEAADGVWLLRGDALRGMNIYFLREGDVFGEVRTSATLRGSVMAGSGRHRPSTATNRFGRFNTRDRPRSP